MSDEPAIPADLYPQREGHGYEAGCECDLVGGDPNCKVQPPYEQTQEYCMRIVRRVMAAEAQVAKLQEQLDTRISVREVAKQRGFKPITSTQEDERFDQATRF